MKFCAQGRHEALGPGGQAAGKGCQVRSSPPSVSPIAGHGHCGLILNVLWRKRCLRTEVGTGQLTHCIRWLSGLGFRNSGQSRPLLPRTPALPSSEAASEAVA